MGLFSPIRKKLHSLSGGNREETVYFENIPFLCALLLLLFFALLFSPFCVCFVFHGTDFDGVVHHFAGRALRLFFYPTSYAYSATPSHPPPRPSQALPHILH